MLTTPRVFIVATVLAVFVSLSSVSAVERIDIARSLPAADNLASPPTVKEPGEVPDLSQANPLGKTPMERLLDGEYPVLSACQTVCKDRYFKEIEKCRRLVPTTFKRQLCIRRANHYGRKCRSVCK